LGPCTIHLLLGAAPHPTLSERIPAVEAPTPFPASGHDNGSEKTICSPQKWRDQRTIHPTRKQNWRPSMCSGNSPPSRCHPCSGSTAFAASHCSPAPLPQQKRAYPIIMSPPYWSLSTKMYLRFNFSMSFSIWASVDSYCSFRLTLPTVSSLVMWVLDW